MTSTWSATPDRPHLTGHILLAEDEPINQLYVVELLKHFGCTCDVAANGEEAILAVRRRPYHLILMDCQMPAIDGCTATREIRRWEAASGCSFRLPIVALTANAARGDRRRCLESGMDEFLPKPVAAEELRMMLEKFLTVAHST